MCIAGSQVLARAILGLLTICLFYTSGGARGAELVIAIPGGAASAGRYRLEYWPPSGTPASNFTVPARRSDINFQGLPGTKYHFMLYYSNDTFNDLLTWNQTIVTAPEPPSNVSVTLGRNKQATISWAPPTTGDYTGFRLKVSGLTERAEGAWNVTVGGDVSRYTLADLAPGATYQLHAFTLLHDKESAAYASRNFTTKPNTPGKFIVWFRNETTLLVLWQPPYPAGHYTHYKVSIVPGDAKDSELYVEKEGEPPGPAQAAFKGLVPGRAYNISVQTVSEPEISAPTTAQYRTVPLRPANVTPTADPPAALTVSWRPPADVSEFDKYQVSLGGAARRAPLVVVARADPPEARFEHLEPGATYTVSVKTMSGKVTSWPAAADVTLPPLAVRGLRALDPAADDDTAVVRLQWTPPTNSTQDSYRIRYAEAGEADEAGAAVSAGPPAVLDTLLAGRNYSVWVAGVSRGVVGPEAHTHVYTRPLAPLLQRLEAGARWLRLAWRSDVDSRQERYGVEWAMLRPAAGAPLSADTAETELRLERLSPGAVYAVSVVGVAWSRPGPPLRLQAAVRPLPPTHVSVERTSSTSVVLRWAVPAAAESAVGAVVLRYRTQEEPGWTELRPVNASATEADVTDMTPGDRYVISVETASLATDAGDRQESGAPVIAEHTVRPNPVSNVATIADTHNLTLEWPAPKGRVDSYHVQWSRVWEEGEERGGGAPDESGVRDVREGRVALGGLWPGARYRVSVWAVSYALQSDELPLEARTRPTIQSEMTLVTEPGGAHPAFLVVFTRTPRSAAHFTHYQFRLEARGEPARDETLPADVEVARLNFTRLVPGRLYNLTMWTVAGTMRSHPVQRQARLVPDPVSALTAAPGPRHVALAWAPPAGDYDDFEVQWLDGEELSSRATSQSALTVRGLRPFTEYTFTVSARAGSPASLLTQSRATSASVRTLEAAPEQLAALVPVDVRPTQIELSWSLPADHHNGELRRFVLEYWRSDLGPDAPRHRADFSPTASSGVLSGLYAGVEYTVRGWAETGAGAGPPLVWSGPTGLGPPPRPPPHAAPAPLHSHTSRLALRLAGDAFSSLNGNLTQYALVVSESEAAPPAALPGWPEVRALPTWPPYAVWVDAARFRAGGAVDVVLGEETCAPPPPRYCNGPLRPNTRYYVRLRGYTAPDKYTDTEYTVVTTEADQSAWWWCGGAALLVAGAGAAVLVLRRRRSRAPRAPHAPAPRCSRPVRVSDFIDHYRLMSADSDFRFSEEFEELKQVGRDQPCSAADLPCNRPKNRFTNILPYDHSRYKLQPVDDEEGSDYINANYVPGHNSPREFIVTQGPLHCTRDDFWRMCWESGSRAIVMLTRCVEKGREKCDRYWPYDTRPVYYGDICVTALNESRYPDWTVTEMGVSRGAEQRVLTHFHFTTWPDFGVPSPPTTLARFVRAFRDRVPPGQPAPVVVHCSAGVGRSGTFITLDRALQQLAAHHDHLDIFGMVYGMRRERVWMVQTEQQYICIHQCLVAVLEGQELSAPPAHPAPPPGHLNAAYDDDEGIAESPM